MYHSYNIRLFGAIYIIEKMSTDLFLTRALKLKCSCGKIHWNSHLQSKLISFNSLQQRKLHTLFSNNE